MNSSNAPKEFQTLPLYFFDQPSKPNRIKGTRNIMYFSSVQLGDTSLDKSDDLSERLGGEPGAEPDTSPSVGAALEIKDCDPLDVYKSQAPQLLNELSQLLSQHKERIPRGIVNILDCSWEDLTAGALRNSKYAEKPEEPKESVKRDETGSHAAPPGRKPQLSASARSKSHIFNQAENDTAPSFSLLQNIPKHPGWIIQSPSAEPDWISVCQQMMKQLQVARNPEKLHTADEDLNEYFIRHFYGDERAKVKDGSERKTAQPAAFTSGATQTSLGVKQPEPTLQKFHYKFNDGSTFIYYPSGCMAVCQSHSGLPCGGFYTNVYSDSERPVMLATITAFGHGAVTHTLSSVIAAIWDQEGGLTCDRHGTIKEWSWQSSLMPIARTVIQVSDLISVRLISGTSATLTYRCNNTSVELPLSALSYINKPKDRPCLKTDIAFTSDTARGLLLKKKNSTAVGPRSKKVPACSQKGHQMAVEVEELKAPSAQWRREGHAAREVKRFQQRVRNILDEWLDCYRVATGIKYLTVMHEPDAPLSAQVRREVLSSSLPSLNPPEHADIKSVQLKDGNQSQEPYPSATPERPLKSCDVLPRLVPVPESPDLRLSAAPPSFKYPDPCMVCPALLRAAVQMEEGRRLCRCSIALMPIVTDLEYDAFIMGQPVQSHQILVVCVTSPRQLVYTHTLSDQDVLDQLYTRMNKHRVAPCTQCQLDSFRLVRYEMSTGTLGCDEENSLLQQRHNAAPGMFLIAQGHRVSKSVTQSIQSALTQKWLQMYVRGKLLFLGYVFSGHSRSEKDLHKQISRSRVDYRLGLSLPSDYKFSEDPYTQKLRPLTKV